MKAQVQHDVPDTDVRQSNPSGNGPHGLAGDLGISSERTGPADGSDGSSIEGTGSHGSAAHATDGVMDTTAPEEQEHTPRVHPEQPAEGADPDESQPDQERTATEEPAEGTDDPGHTSLGDGHGQHVNGDNTSDSTGVDRTVGEVKPDPVVNKHEFDPSRNPRH